MNQGSLQRLAGVQLVLVLLVGCGPTETPPTTVGVPVPSLTPRPASSPTATPVPLPTQTLVLPLALGTPLPQLSKIISSDNINNIIEIARWAGHAEETTTLVFLPDGHMLAAAASENTLQLWDVSSASEPITLSGHTGRVTSAAFSADGKAIASGSEDNVIKLWDVASGQELRTLSGHTGDLHNYGVAYIAFSPDGSMLATVSAAFSNSTSNFLYYLDLWDVASGKQVRTWSEYWIWGAAFSPDSTMLAWATGKVYWTDNNVIVSDVTSGRELRTLSGHTAQVNGVAFSPDGKTLASASDDGTIRLWDPATGGELHTLSNVLRLRAGVVVPLNVTGVAFSPDGRTLASWSEPSSCCAPNNTVTLWDVTSGQELGPLNGYTDYSGSLAFSPDGKLIGLLSGEGAIRLWGVYP